MIIENESDDNFILSLSSDSSDDENQGEKAGAKTGKSSANVPASSKSASQEKPKKRVQCHHPDFSLFYKEQSTKKES